MPAVVLLWSLLFAACTIAPDAGPAPTAPPVGPAADYEATLTRILTATVDADGLVDYPRMAADFGAEFDSVKASIAQRDPVTLGSDAETLAFLLNAYNVWMLDNILGAPEVTNIADDNRFEAFFQQPFRVAGFNMTLNQLENGILRFQDVVDGLVLPEGLQALRPAALDPRIHVGLNCAALSCPKLRREAFTPTQVNAQLDAALAEFADSDRLAAVNGSAVTISSLLDWFGADFDASGMPTGDYFLTVMSSSRPGFAIIQPILAGRDAEALRAFVTANADVSFAYDWTVNRQ